MPSQLSRSRLVRLLAAAAPVGAEAARQDVAERLSQWVDAFDAINLHAAQQSIGAPLPATPVDMATAQALEQQFERVRSALASGIAGCVLFTAQPVAIPPGPAADPVMDLETNKAADRAADLARLRQRHLEQQRLMDTRISALRAQVRQALGAASPRLRQLAALDTVLEQTLGSREQQLLAAVPGLLRQRLEQAAPADQSAWQERASQAWREVLLAELHQRMQSVAGLVQACSHESHTNP